MPRRRRLTKVLVGRDVRVKKNKSIFPSHLRRHELHAEGAPFQHVPPVEDRVDHANERGVEREGVLQNEFEIATPNLRRSHP